MSASQLLFINENDGVAFRPPFKLIYLRFSHYSAEIPYTVIHNKSIESHHSIWKTISKCFNLRYAMEKLENQVIKNIYSNNRSYKSMNVDCNVCLRSFVFFPFLIEFVFPPISYARFELKIALFSLYSNRKPSKKLVWAALLWENLFSLSVYFCWFFSSEMWN